MYKTLDGEVLAIPRPHHTMYIDDINIHGTNWVGVMRDSLYAVACMAAKGLPLGAEKCHYLTREPVVLGFEVDGPRGEYRVGPKAPKQLLGAGLPRSLKEL